MILGGFVDENRKATFKKFFAYFLPDILDAAFSFLISVIGNSIKDRLMRAIIIGILSAIGNFFMAGNNVTLTLHDIIPFISSTK